MDAIDPLLLRTPRLVLYPFGQGDLDKLHHIFTDAFVRKYLWDDELLTPDRTEEVLAVNQKQFQEESCGLWRIEEPGGEETRGFVGLWYFFEEPQPQLIYGLLPAYTGHGFATEASRAVIDYAFESLDFEYIVAATDPPNAASQQVALRLGMTLIEERDTDGKRTVFYRLERPES